MGAGPVRLRILRPGAVTREQLQRLLPDAQVEGGEGEEAGKAEEEKTGPMAPGMRYAHYQPQAAFVLLDGRLEWRLAAVRRQVGEGARVGVICGGEEAQRWAALQTEVEGEGEGRGGRLSVWVAGVGVEGLARELFRALRGLDDEGVERIFAPVVETEGLGAALMNRMDKAAAGRRWTEAEGEEEQRQQRRAVSSSDGQ